LTKSPRLLVVYNRHSSRYTEVRTTVLDRLPSGWAEYQIDNTEGVDPNSAALARLLRPGDRILSAGGDGTASVCVNAILAARQDGVSLGVMPYGNFNDMARTFGRLRLADFTLDQPPRTTPAYPLDLIVNSKHRRYGMCYFTLGMFAESTTIFDHDHIRAALRAGRHSRPRSIRYLADWYLQHRHDQFLPDTFRLNGRRVSGATDYVAVNATSMAGVMRDRHRYYGKRTFLSETGDLGHWLGLFGIVAPSVFWQIPGSASRGDVLEFSSPATVTAQSEGESIVLEQVTTIELKKSKQPINIITRH
jgi:hypothetical protein